jgi:hypothetical protein
MVLPGPPHQLQHPLPWRHQMAVHDKQVQLEACWALRMKEQPCLQTAVDQQM